MSGRSLLILGTCAMLAACAGSGNDAARSVAIATTTAVYKDDYTGVTSHFDSQLEGKISRAEVGLLADKLHSLGGYKSFTYVDGDPVKNEYTYRIGFDKGTMTLVVRVDGDGKLSAYRLFPQS